MMSSPEVHDLVIVGAGPAGLSAAITAESERIDSLLLDSSSRLGGQAGTSSFIENYAGFPEGISGDELMARMVDQALKFDTEFIAPARVEDINWSDEGILVRTDDAETFLGRAALLSTGVEYRRLKARNLAAYLGRGATYGTPHRRDVYRDSKIFIIGGANSAGQAAVYLSDFEACEVHLLIRGPNIEDKMSGYLVDKVLSKDGIHVHTNTELVGVDGNGRLEKVTVKHDDNTENMEADEVFVLIGSVPKTNWLPDTVTRDEQGFVMAGGDIPPEVRAVFAEKSGGRQPFSHETSMPGLFVAGDVRCGTNKRVALAAGDGAAVIPELHRYKDLAIPKH